MGYVVAAYIVGQVKNHDAYCGGPTKIGSISQPFRGMSDISKELWDHAVILNQDEVEELEKVLTEVDLKTKETRNKEIQGALYAISVKEIMRMMSTYEQNPPQN